MIKCYLDSNILIYFKDETSPLHRQALDGLHKLIDLDAEIIISPLVMDEFIYVMNYIVKKNNQDLSVLKELSLSIQEIPNLEMVATPAHFILINDVLSLIEDYGLRSRDAFHLATMLQHKCTHFFTFDTDFVKVFETKAIKDFLNINNL